MSRGLRNQRTCHCRNCGGSFLSYKAIPFCGSECRISYVASHGTTKPTGAYLDGASSTGKNT